VHRSHDGVIESARELALPHRAAPDRPTPSANRPARCHGAVMGRVLKLQLLRDALRAARGLAVFLPAGVTFCSDSGL